MSSPSPNYKKKKSTKEHSPSKEINPIKPEIINYIQKLQGDTEKVKNINQSKSQLPKQVERIILNKLINPNYNALNEDMTFDKDKRFTAKKGLLYLLNNLSKGTFCPDIDEYFAKMKEAKMEEFRKKPKLLDYRSEDELRGDKKKQYNLLKKSPKIESSLNNERLKSLDEISKNVNIRTNKIDKGKYSEINEKFGLKKYDLLNLYDENEIKDNTFQINYNKEKKFKMKIKHKNK